MCCITWKEHYQRVSDLLINYQDTKHCMGSRNEGVEKVGDKEKEEEKEEEGKVMVEMKKGDEEVAREKKKEEK